MVVRIYTRAEFERELERRGFSKTRHRTATTVAWKAPEGHFFLVPVLDDDRYPDWLLDLIVTTNNLSGTPDR